MSKSNRTNSINCSYSNSILLKNNSFFEIFFASALFCFTCSGVAQTLYGGAGGGLVVTAGGESSVGAAGGAGANGSAEGGIGNGGGGGGAGLVGGAGGSGGTHPDFPPVDGAGGGGGLASGNSGVGGRGGDGQSVSSYSGGGGGGGGATGAVFNASGTNSTVVLGGDGGKGGSSGGGPGSAGGGGGGGAGGFGAIVNPGVTLNNTGRISAGVGGAGGDSEAGGGAGGSGGTGVHLGHLSTLNNSGEIEGGEGGAAGSGAVAGINGPGVQVGSGSSARISNTGTIKGGAELNAAILNGAGGVISSIVNDGRLSGSSSSSGAITNHGQIDLVVNTQVINGRNSIYNVGSISAILNRGENAIMTGSNQAIYNSGSIGSFDNSGFLQFGYNAVYNDTGATIATFSNSGSLLASTVGVSNIGQIGSLHNSGFIYGDAAGVVNGSNVIAGVRYPGSIQLISNTATGTISGYSSGLQNWGNIDQLLNAGTISGDNYGIVNGGIITSLTNTGRILGGPDGFGINNFTYTDFETGVVYGGRISTLNNKSAISYQGVLPTQYNLMIESFTRYGRVTFGKISGAMRFNIDDGSIVSKGTYAGVLSGITAAHLVNTSGDFQGFIFNLKTIADNVWDLIVTGASTADTQLSLVNTAASMQATFALQNAVLTHGFSYDCKSPQAQTVCVSAGGRNTQTQASNQQGALLIAAYRFSGSSYRLGLYADQNLSGPGSAAVKLSNSSPLFGVFGAWSERSDGLGAEVKFSAAYADKKATIARGVVGSSEAGSGTSTLNNQGLQVLANYGWAVRDDLQLWPYAGLRYTRKNLAGYSETASTEVTAPLSYQSISSHVSTALLGLGLSHRITPTSTLFASVGLESDFGSRRGVFAATGISGLSPYFLKADSVKNRRTATLGVYADIQKNHRVGLSGNYSRDPYLDASKLTVTATYSVVL